MVRLLMAAAIVWGLWTPAPLLAGSTRDDVSERHPSVVRAAVWLSRTLPAAGRRGWLGGDEGRVLNESGGALFVASVSSEGASACVLEVTLGGARYDVRLEAAAGLQFFSIPAALLEMDGAMPWSLQKSGCVDHRVHAVVLLIADASAYVEDDLEGTWRWLGQGLTSVESAP